MYKLSNGICERDWFKCRVNAIAGSRVNVEWDFDEMRQPDRGTSGDGKDPAAAATVLWAWRCARAKEQDSSRRGPFDGKVVRVRHKEPLLPCIYIYIYIYRNSRARDWPEPHKNPAEPYFARQSRLHRDMQAERRNERGASAAARVHSPVRLSITRGCKGL